MIYKFNCQIAGNTTIFYHIFQYLVSRYFSSDTALEQLSWLLKGCGINMPIGLIDDIDLSEMSAMTFTTFNSTCQIIDESKGNGDFLRQFSNCIDNIKEEFQYPQYYNGLMGLLLLFSNDETYNLKERHYIQSIFKETEELALTGYEDFENFGILSLNKLISTLRRMSSILRKSLGSHYFKQFDNTDKTVNEMDYFEDSSEGFLTQIKPIDFSKTIRPKQNQGPRNILNICQYLPIKKRLDCEKRILETFHEFENVFASVTSGYVVTTNIGKILK